MQRDLELISATGAEPVTLDEAKLWLRIELDSNDENALLQSLIVSARQWAESFCKRSFIAGEQWKLMLSGFPVAERGAYGLRSSSAIELPMGPVASITSIAYLGTDGQQHTVSSSAYSVLQGQAGNALIYPAYATGWPVAQGSAGAVVVTFTAGMPAPENLKTALKFIVAEWYKNRDAEAKDQAEVPPVAKVMLAPMRVMRV